MFQVFLLSVFLLSCSAARIQWTAAGGNPLWNNAGNWDCQCLPTINDDVVIDIQAIPGEVLIGSVVAPALCNSLTVGGSSPHSQTITVNAPINIGSGRSSLNLNGRFRLNAGPDAPVSLAGRFDIFGNGFQWASGTLAGAGTFNFTAGSILNLTGSASKMISANIISAGKIIAYTDRETDLVLKSGSLNVLGQFTTANSLTVSVGDSGAFNVKSGGSLAFTGSQLLFQGSGVNLDNWSVGSSSVVTITNGLNSGTLNLAGTLVLIGAPTDVRSFKTVTGNGAVKNQGGVNNFGSLACSTIEASGGNLTATGTATGLVLSGSFLSGGKLVVSTASLTGGGVVGGLQLQAAQLSLEGVVGINDDGTAVIVTSSGSIKKQSQFTLTGGCSFQVANGASFTQSGAFQLVPGPTTASSPSFVNNGIWTSSSAFSISLVPVTGTGSFAVTSTSTLTLNSLSFAASTIAAQGSVVISAGDFQVSTVTGTGAFSGNPNKFVADSLAVKSFTLTSGSVAVNKFKADTLTINNGKFSVGAANIGTFNFNGGSLVGSSTTPAAVAIANTVLNGSNAQTIVNVQVNSNSLNLSCLSSKCQLFADHASLTTD